MAALNQNINPNHQVFAVLPDHSHLSKVSWLCQKRQLPREYLAVKAGRSLINRGISRELHIARHVLICIISAGARPIPLKFVA